VILAAYYTINVSLRCLLSINLGLIISPHPQVTAFYHNAVDAFGPAVLACEARKKRNFDRLGDKGRELDSHATRCGFGRHLEV